MQTLILRQFNLSPPVPPMAMLRTKSLGPSVESVGTLGRRARQGAWQADQLANATSTNRVGPRFGLQLV